VPALLGMTTVLVVPGGTTEVIQEAWEAEGRDSPHVDFVTENLGAFIEGVVAEIVGPESAR
jgi:putative hydrolase of the HAD superfamily